jgi:hypothetical protein
MSRVLPFVLTIGAIAVTACSVEDQARQRCMGVADRQSCIAAETQKQAERQRELEREIDRQRRARP